MPRSSTGWPLALAAVGLLVLACQPQQVKQSGTVGTNAQVGRVLLRNVHLVQTEDAYRRGETAVVQLSLHNGADQRDALVRVRSPRAGQVVMRWDRECDGKAEPTQRIPLLPEGGAPAAQGQRPGGTPYHLEVSKFTQPARPGTTFPLTLTFERAGEIAVDAKVQATGTRDVRPPPTCGTRPAPPPDPSPRPDPKEITVRGTVRAGVEPNCMLLVDGGRPYLLIGGDRRVIRPGTRLVVRGELRPGVPTTCMQGVVLRVVDTLPA